MVYEWSYVHNLWYGGLTLSEEFQGLKTGLGYVSQLIHVAT